MSTKPLFVGSDFLDDLQPTLPAVTVTDEPMSVAALSLAIKERIESAFATVSVKGEISGLKKAASGHLYFALKDTDAVIDAVCWRGTASKLAVVPEDGLEVVCRGKITAYPSRSKYQIVVDSMQVAGEGALLKLLEERRKKLANEGLFDLSRKKKIPFLPEVIGVVTSPTGAVIRDIMHRLNDRFPRRVLLWGCLVQGENAAQQIAAGIRGFNAIPKQGIMTPNGLIPRPDVIIVARGGGSLEDLWAFNEEIVVRATAESDIPLISAVGHETDTTLIDYASDLRAPTPTGAAEKAVPVRLELAAMLMQEQTRLTSAVSSFLTGNHNILIGLARGLPPLDRIIGDYAQKLDDQTERLSNAAAVLMERKKMMLTQSASRLRKPQFVFDAAQNALTATAFPLKTLVTALMTNAQNRLDVAARLLESCSYKSVLARGFALVTAADGKAVTTARAAKENTTLTLHFADGALPVTTTKSALPKKTPRKQIDDDRQGTLL